MLLDLDILEILTLINILLGHQMALTPPFLFSYMFCRIQFVLRDVTNLAIYTVVPCGGACISC